MGQMQCDTKWQGGLSFATHIRDHRFMMDSKSHPESHDLGPSPKELFLAAICGCSGIDVASILAKMRLNIENCEVKGQTDTTEGYPSIFSEVRLQFIVEGPDVKAEQVLKAVHLSMTKYCGVSAMLAERTPLTYEVFLNKEKIGQGAADFKEAFKENSK